MNYWLLKTEPNSYSIEDLKRDQKTSWTGIRNYQTRNFMRDNMKIGDLVLIYHSNAKPIGVYGIGKIVSGPHADETQFNSNGHYFDPKSTREHPIWICVDVGFVKKFDHPVTLADIKFHDSLSGMMVRAPWSRLSIQPVSENHFTIINKLAQE